MNLTEPQEPIETAVSPEPLPRLWGVILFRLAISGICIYLFYASLSLVNKRVDSVNFYEFTRVMRGTVVTCIWSLAISIGLFFQKRWAVWLVFLFDAVFWAYCIGYSAPGILVESRQMHMMALLVVGLSAWEGTYITTKLWGAKKAKVRYKWAVVVFFIFGIVGNNIEYHRQVSRAKLVLNYADSHLWNLPVGYEKWQFKQEFTKYGEYESRFGRTCDSGYLGYPEYQVLQLTSYDNLGAKHRFRKGGRGLLMYLCGVRHAKVKNQEDALKILRKNGARLPDLDYTTTAEASVKVLKNEPSFILTFWRFKSRSTGIEYLVSYFKDSDSNYRLDDVNIEIPEKEYSRLKRNGWK